MIFYKTVADKMTTGEEKGQEEVKTFWLGQRRRDNGCYDWPTPPCFCHHYLYSPSSRYFGTPAKKPVT
jgi:hypothetical protein